MKSADVTANQQADPYLSKELSKMMHRIDRIVIPADSVIHSTVRDRLEEILKKIQAGQYFRDVAESTDVTKGMILRRVDWSMLEIDLYSAVRNGNPEAVIHPKVIDEFEVEKKVHEDKLDKILRQDKLRKKQLRNNQPVMPGRWRREAYPPRKYVHLNEYAVTKTISDEEGKGLQSQLITPLNGFLGQAYNYDDHGLTEEWMVSFQDTTSSGPSDDDVIRTQIESLLEIMLYTVQDRVCTENGVLEKSPVGLGEDLKEVPVWGIDCYTRRMIEIAIEDHIVNEADRSYEMIKYFIERIVLPAINRQSIDQAHNMQIVISSVLEDSTISERNRLYAQAVLSAIQEQGIDVFRIHPKGTGVICTNPKGIPAHVFISEYLGEMYPAYRWCEKLDVVEQAQKKYDLKPTLPDFYNILLERPRQDPHGYGLIYVDASQQANMGSSCSHSCDSNCTSAVVARNGKLVIALTTNRHVHYGEELTMDYYSITTSDIEWRAAICLCGMTTCRGSFLHYATQDDLQQVLDMNCSPLWRYASLLRSCCSSHNNTQSNKEDDEVMLRHGILDAALGTEIPLKWIKKYAADNLRFIEYERKALPCALLRTKDGKRSLYSYSSADMDARSVMEQRIQSLTSCFSLVQRQIDRSDNSLTPVVTCSTSDAISYVWRRLITIPQLIEEYVIEPYLTQSRKMNNKLNHSNKKSNKKHSNGNTIRNENSGSNSNGNNENNFNLANQQQQQQHQDQQLQSKSAFHTDDVIDYFATTSSSINGEDENNSYDGVHDASTAAAMVVEIKEVNVSTLGDNHNDDDNSNNNSSSNSGSSDIEKIKNVVQDLKSILSLTASSPSTTANTKPSSLTKLKEVCLVIRQKLLSIEEFSTNKARLGQLADIMVLWAHTMNFSTSQAYKEFESDPITVVARELGTNIPRSKIIPESSNGGNSGTRRSSSSSTVATRETNNKGGDVTSDTIIDSSNNDNIQKQFFEAASEVDDSSNKANSDSIIDATSSDGNTTTTTASAVASITTTSGGTTTSMMDPNEPVFVGTMKYDSLYTFNTLLNWYNAEIGRAHV